MVVLRYFTSQAVRARKPNLTTTQRKREQACTAVQTMPETPVLIPCLPLFFLTKTYGSFILLLPRLMIKFFFTGMANQDFF
jgi:hypothetical protein